MRWPACGDRSFHHYQLYRGESAGFVPTQRQLLGSPTRAAFIDPGPFTKPTVFYRVVVVDDWGNASQPSPAASAQLAEPKASTTVTVQMEAGVVSDGARIADDPSAKGGRCVVFGEPDKAPEYAGKVTVPVDLPPGRYTVWLRVKGSALKWAGFFWAGLDATEHYSRMPVARWADLGWRWQQVTFLKSVRDPRERPMTYAVAKRPCTLTMRHRANYMAIDSAFITSNPLGRPARDTVAPHPGCDKAFARTSAAQ